MSYGHTHIKSSNTEAPLWHREGLPPQYLSTFWVLFRSGKKVLYNPT